MSTGWMQILQKQGDTVQHLHAKVQIILGSEFLTMDQALLLARIVEKGSQNAERISSRMREAGLARPYLEASDALQEIYRVLSAAVETKLQGLRRKEIALVPET